MRYSAVTSRQGQLHLDEDDSDIGIAVTTKPDLPSVLKQATHKSHREIEKNPVLKKLFGKNFQLRDYHLILEKMYGYYVPVEQSIQRYMSEHSVKGFEYESKSELLIQDLKAFGLNSDYISNLPIADNTPQIDRLEALVGCVYVLEGSTMGGQVISKHLTRVFDDQVRDRIAFYKCYGKEVMAHWMGVRNWIDDLGANTAGMDFDQAAETAINVFDSMNEWFGAA